MFPSGQWSFNPSAYQNVPYEQVDWASLAQQWIKMKETVPTLNQGPPPQPASQISKLENPSKTSSPPLNDIEGGEAPMDMDTKDDEPPGSIGATASGNWNQWGNWQNQWGWGWSGNAGTVPSADKTQSTSSTVDSKVMSPTNDSNPELKTYVSNVGNFPVIGNAAPCTPQVPGSFNYNNSAGGMIPPIPTKSGPWNENSFRPETVKSNAVTWTKGNRINSRQSQKPVAVEQYPVIDAAKRKQLPAWIREGLNKMEREKQKKMEYERSMQERFIRDQIPPEEDLHDENRSNIVKNTPRISDEPMIKASPMPISILHHPKSTAAILTEIPRPRTSRTNKDDSSLIRKTKDEIMEESMLKVRRILTEILLEATENQVLIIAKEEVKRAKSASAQAVRKSNALSSLSSSLGLNVYDSDDSDSSGNEYIRTDERFNSDEELKMIIDRKRREFQRIEDEIELEIEGQEAKEKMIAQQEDYNEDSDKNSDEVKVDVHRSQRTSHDDTAASKRVDSADDNVHGSQERADGYNKTEENYHHNHHHSSDPGRSKNQLNGSRKKEKAETKRSKSLSSSSSSSSSSSLFSSDSESASSSSKTSASSASKSSNSSTSNSDSDTSSHSSDDKKRVRTKPKAIKESKKSSSKSTHYRSRSRSVSRDRRTGDSRRYSSRSRKNDSFSRRRSSPYRKRSRSRRRSPSRGRESSKSKYSESSKRYDSESKRRRRRSSSNDSRRSRYKRR